MIKVKTICRYTNYNLLIYFQYHIGMPSIAKTTFSRTLLNIATSIKFVQLSPVVRTSSVTRRVIIKDDNVIFQEVWPRWVME